MFSMLAVALFVVADPAVAAESPAPDETEAVAVTDPKSAPFKLKKVCTTQDVVGSSIPRRVCSTKRIYLEPDELEVEKAEPAAEPKS